MALYKKQADKKSGDGLALTEWNDLSSAVAGDAGLTLAINPNDKIGIGTGNPSAKLDIVGDIKANGNISLEPGNTVSVNYGPWTIHNRKFIAFQTNYKGDAGRGQVHLYAPTNYYTNVPAITLAGNYGAGGSVGIGTTSPSEKLEVDGNVKADKFIGDGSQLTNLSVGATGLNLATASGAKVGIGTSNPLGPLSVGDSSVNQSDGFLVIGKKNGVGTRHFRMGFDDNFNFTIGDYGNNNKAGTWKKPFAIHWGLPIPLSTWTVAGKLVSEPPARWPNYR